MYVWYGWEPVSDRNEIFPWNENSELIGWEGRQMLTGPKRRKVNNVAWKKRWMLKRQLGQNVKK